MNHTGSRIHRLCSAMLFLTRVIPLMALSLSAAAAVHEISFQEGVNNYNGTVDTYIMQDQDEASAGHGALPSIEWDSDDPLNTSQYKYALIRFENIIGPSLGQIPLGAVVQSATLTYTVWNSGNQATVNEVLVDWPEDVTWNDFGNDTGVQVDEYGKFVATASGNSIGMYSIDVTDSLSAFTVSPLENHGWIFRPSGNDGVDIRSSEYTTVVNRPVLVVQYDDTVNLPPNPPVLNGPADDAMDVTISPVLDVSISDPEAEDMTVTFWGREHSANTTETFSIVVLPDTQYYSESYPDIFVNQTQWIVDNKDDLNIVYVAHEGDLVNLATNQTQWERADAAMGILDVGGIPYGVVPGNHDEASNYNVYFGVNRFCTSYPDGCRDFYGNGYPSGFNDSSYILFSVSGMDFIVINLDYTNPATGILSWADARLKEYSDRRAIVVSHNILALSSVWDPWGEQIYEALKNNPNLFLMLCGHNHGEARRLDVYNSNIVHTLLADYQGRSNGGNGWLRILEFVPSENKINVKTYSPWLNLYETDNDSQFVLYYDMADRFEMIGSNTPVVSGSETTMEWVGLNPFLEHEWQVKIHDGVRTTTGSVWSFTTTGIKGDITGDCDVDGEDLYEYILDNDVVNMSEFTDDFGKIGCP